MLIYSLPVPVYLCLIVLEGISTIAHKVSPFDQFKTAETLLKEVEDGAGANIFPRHPIIHEKDEGGSKRHIIENNAIAT